MSEARQRRSLFGRPGAVVVGAAVLVVGVSGTSVAAYKIGTGQLRDGAVTSAKIRNNTILSRDIKNGAIQSSDLAPNARKAGPRGATGATGPQGPQGPAGAGRWVLVNADGTIAAQSGGFSVTSRYDAVAGTPAGAVANVYIDANEDLSNNSVVATIALQNQVEQNSNSNTNGLATGGDVNPEFSGEITATACAITGVVACAPTGTNNREHFVVSPRLSDGDPTTATNRKRFYVVVSGNSNDVNATAAGIPAVALAN